MLPVAERVEQFIVPSTPNVEPEKVNLDSAVAVPSPSDVKTLFAPSPAIEFIATVTV